MSLFVNLQKENIIVDCKDKDKESILKTIAKKAVQNPDMKNITEQNLLELLKKREDLVSTGIGNGVGIPHCILKDISEFVMG